MSGSAWHFAAQVTNAQWAAVSVFEAVIDLPDRLATSPATGTFGKGSPARYHVPMAPLVLGSAIGEVVSNWRTQNTRAPLLAAFGCTAASGALTAYLVRAVNLPLLHGQATGAETQQLTRRWHAGNRARVPLILIGGILRAIATRRSLDTSLAE